MDASVASALAQWKRRKRLPGHDLEVSQIAAQGQPEALQRGRPSVPWEARLWDKVSVGADHWIWLGAIDSSGYAYLRTPVGVTTRVHRLVWELLYGDPGRTLRNTCGVQICVRPNHYR